MAKWQITITGKRIQKRSVESLVEQLKWKFEEANISVEDATPPEGRAERFQAAVDKVTEAKEDITTLKDELQEWYDNLPEQFQSGQKGDDLQEAINELESLESDLENCEGREIIFPSMMG